MNREAIIRMAREAEFHPIVGGIVEGNLLRFAALVASAEREEIIKIANDLRYWDDSELLIKAIQARGSDAEAN